MDELAQPDWWPYGAEFPDWQAWRGVTGLLYARRVGSSPPKVVRARRLADLPAGIETFTYLDSGA